jgi:hypothetical protein
MPRKREKKNTQPRICGLCGRRMHESEQFWVHRYMRKVDDLNLQVKYGKPLYEDLGYIWVCGKCSCEGKAGYIRI